MIAKAMKVRVEKGEIDEVISLIKKATELQHFQNLEIGQRNPYRFKIVVPGELCTGLKSSQKRTDRIFKWWCRYSACPFCRQIIQM